MSMTHHECTLYDLLRSSVERDPCKVAIVDGDVEYAYEDLHSQTNALCAVLQEAGVKRMATGSASTWRSPRWP